MKSISNHFRLRLSVALFMLISLGISHTSLAQLNPWRVFYFDGDQPGVNTVGVQDVPKIDFLWDDLNAPSVVNEKVFSFIATNDVIAPQSGTTVLKLTSNEYFKLQIIHNGFPMTVLESDPGSTNKIHYREVNMVAGSSYSYRLEWTKEKALSEVKLEWLLPAAVEYEFMRSLEFLSTVKLKEVIKNLNNRGEFTGTVYSINVLENYNQVIDGIQSISISKTTGWKCSDVGANPIEVTITDNDGNQRTETTMVNIQDVTPPTIATKHSPFMAYLDENGEVTVTKEMIDQDFFNAPADACGIASTSWDGPKTFYCNDVGNHYSDYTVTDVNGNQTTESVRILVVDSISPTAVPRNRTFRLDPQTNSITKFASAFHHLGSRQDNCTVPEDITVVFGNTLTNQMTFDCRNIGTRQVPLILTDANGNSRTIYGQVTILEETPPVVMARPITLELDADGNASLNPQLLDNGSSDNCGITEYLASKTNFTGADLGDNAVTFTVKDASGNEASALTTVTVIDNIAPVVNTTNVTVSLNSEGTKTILGQLVDNGSSDNSGSYSRSLDLRHFDCSHLGQNTVTLTLTDASGNTASAAAIVTVIDDDAPVVVLNGDAEISINLGDSYNELGAISTDNCSSSVTIGGDVVNVNQVGIFTVTYQATDGSNNASPVITRTVNVLDNVDPEISVNDIEVNNDAGVCGALISNFGVTATDNASTPTVSFDIPEGSLFNIGSTTVTATATDASGNQVQASFTVTVNDTEAPTIWLNGAATIEVDLGNAFVDPGASSSDNCSSIVTIGGDAVNTNQLGSHTVTYQATDPSNNTSSILTRTVNVVDNEAPNVVTKNITVSLNSSGTKKIQGVNVDDGSSDNSGSYTRKLDINTFDCDDLGANEVTLTLTDPSGNKASNTAIVTVVDDSAPTISLVGNASITIDFGGLYTELGATTSDNCSSSISIGGDVVNTNLAGTYTVTYQATDIAGNTSATLTRTIDVIDNVFPELTVVDIVVDNDTGVCGAIIPSFNANASDNTGAVNLEFTVPEGSLFNIGTTTVTATATDPSDNVTEKTFTVTVNDVEAPTLTLNGNDVVTVDLNSTYNEKGATISDNCSSVLTIDGTVNTSVIGNYGLTYTAVDPSGNTVQQTRIVQVRDISAPVVRTKHITVSLNASGSVQIRGIDVDDGSSDNSGFYTRKLDVNTFSCDQVGDNNNRVKLTLTDPSGNKSSDYAYVTVVDTTPPTISLNGDPVMNVGYGSTFIDPGATTDDNCESGLSINGMVHTSQLGTYVLTYTAFDPSENISEQITRTVNVVDTVAPSINVRDFTLPNDNGQCGRVLSDFLASASDDTSTPTLSFDIEEGSYFPVGTTIVTATAVDAAGNEAQESFVVKVVDTERPIIRLTAGNVVSVDQGATDIPQGFTVMDNCQTTVSVTGTVDTSTIGTYQLTYAITDGAYKVQQIMYVRVLDTEAPKVVTQDIEVSLNENGSVRIFGSDIDGGSSDNSGFYTRKLDVNTFDCSNLGANEVTLTLTDKRGNQASETAVVTVVDDIAPEIALIGDSSMTIEHGATYTEQGATTTDNCSSTMTIGGDVVNTNQVGTYTVTYQATDASNNTSQQLTRTVNVVDNVAPVITATDITVNNDPGQCGATVASFNATATDNASTPNLTFNIAEGTVFNIGSTIVTVTATDASENQSETSFTVTVNDTEAPTILLTGPSTLNLEHGTAYTEQGATTTDNCSSTVTIGGDAVNTNQLGTYTVTYQATDASNNTSAQVTRTVNVVDNIAPVITATDITVSNDPSQCGASIASFNASATDNASTPSLTFDIAEGTQFSVGSTTVTATATDASGNKSQESFTVTVNDTESPVITDMPTDIALEATGDCSAQVMWTLPTASDNCEVTLTGTHSPGDSFAVGTTVITYTAIDASGNQSQESFSVTVTASPMTLTLTPSVTEVACQINDASIDASIEGGCAPYTYSWNTGQTTEDLSGVSAGDYVLTVTDANGTSIKESVTITEAASTEASIRMYPKRPVFKYGEKHTIYLGYGIQKVLLKAKGKNGEAPYTYEWKDDPSIKYTWKRYAWVKPQQTTTYEVTVTDKNGCSDTETFTVEVIDIRCNDDRSRGRSRWSRRWQPTKVQLCRNGRTICVNKNAVWAYLKKGYSLGACDSNLLQVADLNLEEADQKLEAVTKLTMTASPNPVQDRTMIRFSSTVPGPAQIKVYNTQGIEVANVYEGNIEAKREYKVEFSVQNIPNGILIVKLHTQLETKNLKLLVRK